MTDQEYIEAFKKLDLQFEFHLKLYERECMLSKAKKESDKQLLKKQIEHLEFVKRISGL